MPAKQVTRLHSVKFTFGTSLAGLEEQDDLRELVFDTPFSPGNHGIPEKFVFRTGVSSSDVETPSSTAASDTSPCLVEIGEGGSNVEELLDDEDSKQGRQLQPSETSGSQSHSTHGSGSLRFEDRRHLLQYNRPLPPKLDTFVHHVFALQVLQRPHAPAIQAWDGRLTYAELDYKSNRLAQYLRSLCVRPRTYVPVLFEKSVWSIVALLAVVKAGGAVVALDPSLPLNRLHSIIQDVGASIVLTSPRQLGKVPNHIAPENCVVVDEQSLHMLPLLSATAAEDYVPISPDDALYVVFTSGSTGKPKGVVVSHASFCSSSAGFTKAIHLHSPNRRVLQYSSFAFDLSMLEIFSTLTVGSCICIPSDEDRLDDLAKSIADLRVNWAILTPTVANLLDPKDVEATLEILVLAGEALPVKVADEWVDHVQVLINGYGPAECSCLSIVSEPYEHSTDRNASSGAGTIQVPLGRSPNCAVWIVNADFDGLVPVGEVGEIVLEGPPVATGYLGDEARTSSVFLQDPGFLGDLGTDDTDSSRFYRTGDLGRMSPRDGSIEFVGRRDAQVKIHGQRVELGEIEHHVKSFLESKTVPERLDVVVELVKPEDGTGDESVLAAFPAFRGAESKVASEDIFLLSSHSQDYGAILRLFSGAEEYLGMMLPAYMVPRAIIPCSHLPLTSSGKVDRRTLRGVGSQLLSSSHELKRQQWRGDSESVCSLPSDDSVDRGSTFPATSTRLSSASHPGPVNHRPSEVEKSLRSVWAKVLRLPEQSISPDDDFFKIGGDSIGAIKVVAGCRKASLQIHVETIFKSSVFRDMARACTELTTSTPAVAHSPFSFLHPQQIPELREEAAFQCEVDAELIEDLYPCTHMQEGLMAVNLTRPGAYTGRWIHRLPPNVDLSRFERVWKEIYTTTPILRTRFVTTTSAGSLQAVVKGNMNQFMHNDLETYIAADEAKPMLPGMDLNRFALVADEHGTKYFVWTIHHMLYDGWSLALLCKRVNDLYWGRAPEPTQDYRNFIAYTQSLDRQKSAEYWARELHASPASTFPAPSKPGHQSYARAVVRDRIELGLDKKSSLSGLTLPTLVRAAWAIMISQYSQSPDVLFGAVVSGRNAPVPDIEHIDGPTLATVPVRLHVQSDSAVFEFLRHVQDHASAMIPFEQTGLQQIKTFSENTARACDFQNCLIVQAGGWEDDAEPLGKPEYREEFTTFPVTCEVWLRAGHVDFATHVDEDITSRAFVAEAIGMVKVILKQLYSVSASYDTAVKLGELNFEDDLPNENAVTSPTPGQEPETSPQRVWSTVHHLISETAKRQPRDQAVCSTADSASYADLEDMSSRLARHLVRSGVKPGCIIPLCFEKSIWTVVSMLAVLKAGAAFVALEPSQPLARLQEIVKAVQAQFVLMSPFHAGATDLGQPQQRIIIDATALRSLPDVHHQSPLPLTSPSDLAYLIFTSGSTGTPKGAMTSHSAFASSAVAHGKALEMGSGRRVLQFSSYSFDVSMLEILTTLIHGGTICVASDKERVEDPSAFIRDMKADWAFLTPSVARLLDPHGIGPGFRTLALGGEAPDEALIAAWLGAGKQVINAYGPSECAVISVTQVYVTGIDPRTIGRPVGCSAWVVDSDDVDILVSTGSTGELLIEGPILGEGYLNDQQRTSDSFILDPVWAKSHDGSPPRRFYKTGDLVFQNEAGLLIYVGRNDSQVKINGQRVELGDVEAHLAACDGVRTCAVLFPRSGPLEHQLTAVLDVQSTKASIDVIRSQLCEKIPIVMVPIHWVDIATISSDGKFPLSAAGKLDRRRILEKLTSSQLPPADPTQETQESAMGPPIQDSEQPAYSLAKMIYSLLASKTRTSPQSTGEDPDIFHDMSLPHSALDSLNMMSLMHFVHKTYGIRVSMQLLMDRDTNIRSLARFITVQLKLPVSSSAESRMDEASLKVDLTSEINRYDGEIASVQNLRPEPHGPTPTGYGRHRDNDDDLTVLLTGANGYLGTQVLRQLTEHRAVGRVMALVRGSSPDSCRRRTIDAAVKARWWTDLHAEKLEVWQGDLSQAHLGLGPLHWELLVDGKTVDVVIHDGAEVHWNKSYAALEAVNVRSTVELAKTAAANPRMRFVYVSGGREWRAGESEDDEVLAEELASEMGYVQTKFVAEVLVRRAAKRLAPRSRNMAAVRPGLVIGTLTEGVANSDDFLWRMVAACIRLGMYNADEEDLWLHLSDVETTAGIVVDAALHLGPDAELVFKHGDGMTWGGFWSVIRGMGYTLHPRSGEEWLSAVRSDIEAQREQHPLWPLAHMLTTPSEQAEKELPRPESDHSGSAQAAPTTAVPSSLLHLKVAVRRNVEFLVNIGFLPPLSPMAMISGSGNGGFSRRIKSGVV